MKLESHEKRGGLRKSACRVFYFDIDKSIVEGCQNLSWKICTIKITEAEISELEEVMNMCGCLAYLFVGLVMCGAFYEITCFWLKGVAEVVALLSDISGLKGFPLVLFVAFLGFLTVRMLHSVKAWCKGREKERRPNVVESLLPRGDGTGTGWNKMKSMNEEESEGSVLGDLSDEEIFERSLWELKGKSWGSVDEMLADLRMKYRVNRVERYSVMISKLGGGSGTYRLGLIRYNDGLVIITSFFLLGFINDCNGWGTLSDYGVYSSDEDSEVAVDDGCSSDVDRNSLTGGGDDSDTGESGSATGDSDNDGGESGEGNSSSDDGGFSDDSGE